MQMHPEDVEIVVAPDLATVVLKHAPTKLLFVATPARVTQALAGLSESFAGILTVLRSHANFGELTPLHVSKGTALAGLAAQLGLSAEQVMAIGDQENDLPMIRWAGLGLAMGNAIQAVKAVASAVIPPVSQDGVAWAIEHYILQAQPGS